MTHPSIWWHGSRAPLTDIDWRHRTNGGLHLGTQAQALVRGAQLKGFFVAPHARLRRSKDTGKNWGARAADARARGFDALIYLNRYEGIAAFHSSGNLDTMPDSAFARLHPDARDSLLILNPDILVPLTLEEMMQQDPISA